VVVVVVFKLEMDIIVACGDEGKWELGKGGQVDNGETTFSADLKKQFRGVFFI
jgi:hypothetical protein